MADTTNLPETPATLYYTAETDTEPAKKRVIELSEGLVAEISPRKKRKFRVPAYVMGSIHTLRETQRAEAKGNPIPLDFIDILLQLPKPSRDLFTKLKQQLDKRTNLSTFCKGEFDSLFDSCPVKKSRALKPLLDTGIITRVPVRQTYLPDGTDVFMFNPDIFIPFDPSDDLAHEKGTWFWDVLGEGSNYRYGIPPEEETPVSFEEEWYDEAYP